MENFWSKLPRIFIVTLVSTLLLSFIPKGPYSLLISIFAFIILTITVSPKAKILQYPNLILSNIIPIFFGGLILHFIPNGKAFVIFSFIIFILLSIFIAIPRTLVKI